MSEIWKPASRYEGFYEVSTFGRVRSVAKDVWCGKGYRHRKGKILKPYITYGYPRVHLSKDGIKHNVMVHRLVAETFIPNPLNHPCINHKDENPMNPHVDNLEWCTYEYNSNYGTHRERMSKMFLNYPKYSLPVVRFTKDGVYVDVVDGEILFTSDDKFDSGCGWPAFSRPVSDDVIIKHRDFSHGTTRIEVRSAKSNSHLGHLFHDGPGGSKRYCINSASLKFIPQNEVEKYLKNKKSDKD